MARDEQVQPIKYVLPSGVRTNENGAAVLHWSDGAGPFGHDRPIAFNDSLVTVQCRAGVLSPDECRTVIELGESLPRIDGRTELPSDAYRVSHIAWIEPQPQNHWLFHRLGMLFADANRDYGFELTGFLDPLQYTMYGSGQHFDWHVDCGAGESSARKLSMTLQLTDPQEYSGGALELLGAKVGEEARQLGSATFFPSFLGHRVTPVTRGIRRSLVAWACGPAFR